MSTATNEYAGFLVWVAGTRGPEPQKWAERPLAIGSDYWSLKGGRIVSIVAVPAKDWALPIDVLARLYPGAGGVEPPVEVEKVVL